jgi:sugar O-acyltransferase (sialic acid O-acetyltransferase NeuD family)
MFRKSIVLFGGGSPLLPEIEEICIKSKINIKAIVNNIDGLKNFSISNAKIVELSEVEQYRKTPFCTPLFTPQNRFFASKQAMDLGFIPFIRLNFPQNLISINVEIQYGSIINKGTIVGTESKIGKFVLINRGVNIGHHNVIDDFVSIGPGVVTSGNVKIGRGSLIGAGSVILPSIKIGQFAIVGAGSVVVKDVKDQSVVVGNPAFEIKKSNVNF